APEDPRVVESSRSVVLRTDFSRRARPLRLRYRGGCGSFSGGRLSSHGSFAPKRPGKRREKRPLDVLSEERGGIGGARRGDCQSGLKKFKRQIDYLRFIEKRGISIFSRVPSHLKFRVWLLRSTFFR